MKSNSIDFAVFVIGIMLLVIASFNALYHHQEMNAIDDLNTKMDLVLEAVEHRDYLDSLTYDHMKNCSYIMDDEVLVGGGGVLYSQYHRKYNK